MKKVIEQYFCDLCGTLQENKIKNMTDINLRIGGESLLLENEVCENCVDILKNKINKIISEIKGEKIVTKTHITRCSICNKQSKHDITSQELSVKRCNDCGCKTLIPDFELHEIEELNKLNKKTEDKKECDIENCTCKQKCADGTDNHSMVDGNDLEGYYQACIKCNMKFYHCPFCFSEDCFGERVGKNKNDN